MKRLSQNSLNNEERKYPIKVLQFGEGNFLRAFVDWMIDAMNKSSDFNAGVAVVQPMPSGMIDMFVQQDGLYHLMMNGVEQGEVKSDTVLIDCLKQFVNPYTQYDAYLELATCNTLSFIVSNTTEAGIAFDSEDVLGSPQKSFPGKLTAWLYHRYLHFKGDPEAGLVILPCELIDRNGEILKEVVLQFIALWGLEDAFKAWICEANIFANTLVDRIVPGFPKDKIAKVYEALGVEDHVVVESERFHLWVIEGPAFIEAMLPFKNANLNIIITQDMTPYRTRKVRILNGAHTLMVPVALLAGTELVMDAVNDPILGRFLNEVLDDEVIPTIDMPVSELIDFKESVIERFKNPFIKHYFTSIALNSISKFKTRVLPSLLGYRALKNEVPVKTAFSLAALIKLYAQEKVKISDDQEILDFFASQWENCHAGTLTLESLVQNVLSNTSFWGEDLTNDPKLTASVTHHLKNIMTRPMTECIQEV